MILYVDGDYRSVGPLIDARDRGFLLGDGLFETLLLVNGWPIFLKEHLQRLNTGCGALKIPITLNIEDVLKIISELVKKNKLNEKRLSARITITRGQSVRGLLFPEKGKMYPTVVVTVSPLGSVKDFFSYRISQYTRASTSLSSSYKTTNYLDNVMARNEVSDMGCDEAVMLNEYGRVACGSMSNVYIMKLDGMLFTPSVGEGALPGVVRAKVSVLAERIGLQVHQAELSPEELKDGLIFFTNSLIGLVAGEQNSNELFSQLREAYEDCIANDIRSLRNSYPQ